MTAATFWSSLTEFFYCCPLFLVVIKFLIHLVWLCFRIYRMKENLVGDSRWQLFCCSCRMFVLIYDELLLSGQPPLSSHLLLPGELPAPNGGSIAVVCNVNKLRFSQYFWWLVQFCSFLEVIDIDTLGTFNVSKTVYNKFFKVCLLSCFIAL